MRRGQAGSTEHQACGAAEVHVVLVPDGELWVTVDAGVQLSALNLWNPVLLVEEEDVEGDWRGPGEGMEADVDGDAADCIDEQAVIAEELTGGLVCGHGGAEGVVALVHALLRDEVPGAVSDLNARLRCGDLLASRGTELHKAAASVPHALATSVVGAVGVGGLVRAGVVGVPAHAGLPGALLPGIVAKRLGGALVARHPAVEVGAVGQGAVPGTDVVWAGGVIRVDFAGARHARLAEVHGHTGSIAALGVVKLEAVLAGVGRQIRRRGGVVGGGEGDKGRGKSQGSNQGECCQGGRPRSHGWRVERFGGGASGWEGGEKEGRVKRRKDGRESKSKRGAQSEDRETERQCMR